MLSSRLFWKLFLVYALLSAITAASVITILGDRLRGIAFEQESRRLHDSAVTMVGLLGNSFDTARHISLTEAVNAIAIENSTRITLIREDGVVIEDSESDPLTMENHADRIEVELARKSGTGSSRRVSPTLGISMLYLAIRVGDASNPVGYVRLSVAMDAVEAEINFVQKIVGGTFVAVSLLALAPMFLILRRIIQPLVMLKTAANAITSGDLQQVVRVDRRDELGSLAEAFNTMSHDLSARMFELRRTSQELSESSRLLSTVFGSMVEGVIAVDNDENILFANEAAREQLDFRDRDLVGRPVWECVRNETVRTVVRQAMSGLERSVECQLPRHGTIVEIEATPLAENPCPGVVLVFHDVTELRRLENIRREFASNVSHELKTPLTIIQTSAETLLDGAIDDPEFARRFIHRIDEQGQRLHALIMDLLQLSRIESREQSFDVTAVPVRQVVKSLADQLITLAQSRNVALELDETAEEIHVAADAGAFRTIMENLLSNGLKYTPGGGRVAVSWKHDDTHAVISVQDSGVGISREHQKRIFERFFRVDRARTREIGGTGLGLAIVKHLASVFDAQVSVQSEVGKGSIFSLRIPLWQDASEATSST
ncbi:MAG: HAMP domain-containing protein [Rhodopirellula sp.]|nr:HAMP domain-containing protein [Rhodopirellula sp.]